MPGRHIMDSRAAQMNFVRPRMSHKGLFHHGRFASYIYASHARAFRPLRMCSRGRERLQKQWTVMENGLYWVLTSNTLNWGYFHFIYICTFFLHISQKLWDSKAKCLVFYHFCRLNIERTRALESSITFFGFGGMSFIKYLYVKTISFYIDTCEIWRVKINELI